jgi:Na+/phosphate symporter
VREEHRIDPICPLWQALGSDLTKPAAVARLRILGHHARMLTIVWPALIAVLGALFYLLSANAKRAELGKILFFVGAFWTAYLLTGQHFQIGR